MGSSTIHDGPLAGEHGTSPASIVDGLKAVVGNPRAARASVAKGFNPAILAGGSGRPPDEIFAARETAYEISLATRCREQAAV